MERGDDTASAACAPQSCLYQGTVFVMTPPSTPPPLNVYNKLATSAVGSRARYVTRKRDARHRKRDAATQRRVPRTAASVGRLAESEKS